MKEKIHNLYNFVCCLEKKRCPFFVEQVRQAYPIYHCLEVFAKSLIEEYVHILSYEELCIIDSSWPNSRDISQSIFLRF